MQQGGYAHFLFCALGSIYLSIYRLLSIFIYVHILLEFHIVVHSLNRKSDTYDACFIYMYL